MTMKKNDMKLKPKTYTFFIPQGQLSYVAKLLKDSKARHWPFIWTSKDNKPGYSIEVEDHPVVSFIMLKYCFSK